MTLLNAALAALRKATSLGLDALPDIAPAVPDSEAASQFTAEFSRAAQAQTMPATQLAYLATEGMLESLHDSLTRFERPRNDHLGLGPGIEVTLVQRKDASGIAWIFVADVFSGSPAAEAGIQRFDKIIQIDGKSQQNVSPLDATQLIRGAAGTTVELVVQRSGQTHQISVVRKSIRVRPLTGRWLRPSVAYLKRCEFSDGVGREMRSMLEKLRAEAKIDSIVLDLRGNAGGLVSEAVNISSIFLPEGTILAHFKQRGQSPSVLRTSGTPLLTNTRLVVLVDGGSAAASEIVAGALKNSRRATIIGEKSAGALGGSITRALPEGRMAVTVARIMGPNNERVDGVGITPDVPATLTVTEMEHGQDTQLEVALRTLTP